MWGWDPPSSPFHKPWLAACCFCFSSSSPFILVSYSSASAFHSLRLLVIPSSMGVISSWKRENSCNRQSLWHRCRALGLGSRRSSLSGPHWSELPQVGDSFHHPVVFETTLQGPQSQGPIPRLRNTLLWHHLAFRMDHKLLLKAPRPSGLPHHQLEPSGHSRSLSGPCTSLSLCWN